MFLTNSVVLKTKAMENSIKDHNDIISFDYGCKGIINVKIDNNIVRYNRGNTSNLTQFYFYHDYNGEKITLSVHLYTNESHHITTDHNFCEIQGFPGGEGWGDFIEGVFNISINNDNLLLNISSIDNNIDTLIKFKLT